MRVDNKTTSNVSTKTTIHIVHILDASGSMGYYPESKYGKAVASIDDEIAELKKETDINYVFSLVKFDTNVSRLIWQKPIRDVSAGLSQYNFGSMTALYQAIGETLESYPQENPVLVKIFTDGGENASRGKYNNARTISELISHLEKKDFTITFVGTQGDVNHIQNTLGIAKGNTLVHDNTSDGVEHSFRKSLDATKKYAANVSRGEFTKTFEFYS